MYQPFTTDSTLEGQKTARNSMRLRLWNDPVFAHRWLCHPERDCKDGCDNRGIHSRVMLYTSDLE